MRSRFNNGFYIILLIGISLIAITVIISSKNNIQNSKEDKLMGKEDFVILEDELEPSLEITRMDEQSKVDDSINNKVIQETFEKDEIEEDIEEEDTKEDISDEEKEEDLEEDLNYTLVDSVSTDELEIMAKPVEGELGLGFTERNLIYSKTLEEWTSHKGIDIFASEGTEVMAVLPGIVAEVYKDEMWGIVIIIDHGNGLLSKYANLSTDSMVNEGVKVKKGDVISKVGKTASIEMMDEPHLHFEIIKDGLYTNPLDYLPVFASGK